MIWISHVGRKSDFVDATPSYVREVVGDVHAAGEHVAAHLHLPTSDMAASPPVWALEPIGVAGLHVRPAVRPRLIEMANGVLLRSDPVAGFDPTRLTADIDLLEDPAGCRIVVRWDAAVELAIPKFAKRPASQIVGRTVGRLVDELFLQLHQALR